MSNVSILSRHTRYLLEHIDLSEFPTLLIDMFKELIDLDDASIILYPSGDMPLCEYLESPSEGGSLHMDRFVKAPFLLDPYYLASIEGKTGFFQLQELAPKGFRKSEYYNSWYRLSGLHDECGYIIDTGAGNFVNISLGRTINPANFRKAELQLLCDITPIVETLVQKRWRFAPGNQNQLRHQLQTALNAFGDSLLTEREKQVVNMILRGHSTRSASEKLSIAMETVKLHRKHAYAKLEINSQAELFYLFIDSLMSVEDYREGDALATYLNMRTGQQ